MDAEPSPKSFTTVGGMITANKQLILLVIPMAGTVILAALFSFFTLYQNELSQQEQTLVNAIALRKNMLEKTQQSGTPFDSYLTSHRLTTHLFNSREDILARPQQQQFGVLIHLRGNTLSAVPDATTGETYLFTVPGQDAAFAEAGKGQRGSGIFSDYRGQRALTAYTPVEINHQPYVLVAKIDLDEIRRPYLMSLLLIFGVTALVAIIAVPTFGRLINPVLLRLQKTVKKQRENEQELRKRSSIIEESPASIIITDLEFRIEYVNPAFVINSGYSAREIIGQNVRILQSGYTPQEVYQAMFDTIEAGHSWRGELLNRKKNGELFWESTTISPIRGHDGVISHYAAIKEDITDRKQAEEELRRHRDNLQELVAEQTAHIIAAKEEAEAANQAKSAFLANTSHEIRTPMNAIIGMSELLLETRLDADQRGYLTTVAKSARSLLELLNQVLDLSKLEGGKMTLEQIPFDLRDTLEEALVTFYASARTKNILLKLDISPDIKPCRIGDPTRLRQIIINLVGNALKFTPQGHVSVAVTRHTVEGQLHFRVEDTGIGIAADRLDLIFESFTQADQSTARKHGGTGLGTTISKQFVELMHGKIWVESEVDVGSTFHFTIEAPEAPEDMQCRMLKESQRSGWRALRPLHILLVDDVEENIELATVRLEQRHHHVTTARNGHEALHAYLLGQFDLILMDIQMPEMDGYEASTEIREREKESGSDDHHTPIIALTASVLKPNRDRCIAAGMDDVVSKPIDFDELYRVMAQLLPDAFEEVTETKAVAPPLSIEIARGLVTLDVNAAIDIWNDETAYRTALQHFVRSHQQTLAEFQQCVDDHNIDQAKQIAHRIKGVSANLALKTLTEITKKLDNLLKKDDITATRTLLPLFTTEWENTLAAIHRYLDEQQTKEKRECADMSGTKTAETAEQFGQLLAALDKGDADEIEALLAQIKLCICPEKLTTLEHAIYEFDFDHAAEEVRALAGHMGLVLKGRN